MGVKNPARKTSPQSILKMGYKGKDTAPSLRRFKEMNNPAPTYHQITSVVKDQQAETSQLSQGFRPSLVSTVDVAYLNFLLPICRGSFSPILSFIHMDKLSIHPSICTWSCLFIPGDAVNYRAPAIFHLMYLGNFLLLHKF